jgi:YesN/AraC family two-component response regulator
MDKDTILKLRKLCHGLKVLYVEDDENISKQLHRILKKIFNNIDIEINGKDGLAKYEEHHHDIVITDISMPIMNGIEMSHKIKKINKDQVIIVTSAHSEMKYMSKLIDIGVNKFILKPIDLNNFLELLAKTAIKIFKEKKENSLLDKKMKDDVFGGMDNPIAIINDNKLKYVNEVFKENFLKDSDGNIGEFKISHIFKDKEMLILENQEIVKRIIGLERAYEILHINSKIYKAYKIDVVKTDEEENQYLLNFINIDFVINNLEKANINNISGFQTRRDFVEKIHTIYNDDKNYNIFCFGLKNLQEYIKEYGAKQINFINSRLSSNVKQEFNKYIKKEEVDIYLFDTNRYILIANASGSKQIAKSLNNFGENYKCTKGRELRFNLDFIVEHINKELSLKDIIENTEAMLYMLKD